MDVDDEDYELAVQGNALFPTCVLLKNLTDPQRASHYKLMLCSQTLLRPTET